MGEIILGGRYIIDSEIGTGGMAIVYKAHDKMLNRTVAVKVLRPEFKQDEEFIKRFDTEAKAAAGLSHPNIVSIYDVGIHEGLRYIVMEYVDGVTLKEHITKMERLPWRAAFKIATNICSALAHAHERKVIHRDIKPHNIMVKADGTVKVMDFGIARATSASTMTLGSKVLGSAHYLSPEQARGGFTDERSDLYSLGVCVYEMVTGKVPFEADTTVAVAMQHLQKEPEKPSLFVSGLPEAAEHIILKAMRKEQAQRYLTASAMESDIMRLLADPGVTLSDDDNEGFYSTRQIDTEEIASRLSKEQGDKNKKAFWDKKKRKIAGIALLAAMALGAFFAIGKVAFDWFYADTKTLETPNLKGLTLEQAEEKISELDGEIVIHTSGMYSLREEKDKIISQEPAEGRPVPGSKEIYVVIGLGEKEFELENYVGENSDYAAELIKELGLECRILEEEDDDYNEKTDKGDVTRQEPEAGKTVKQGDIVVLYESVGNENIDPKVPDVKGFTVEEAKTALNNKGYYNIKVTEKSGGGAPGTVIKQKPESPERMDVEEIVELTVSVEEISETKGQLKFTVPEGNSPVNVKVIRRDNGETVYRKTHNPLDSVSIEVRVKDAVTYEIYINDVFYEEKRVQG